jgi:hypothetical protein
MDNAVVREDIIEQLGEFFPWEVDGPYLGFTTKVTLYSSRGVTILRATLEDVNGLDFEEFEWELREKLTP